MKKKIIATIIMVLIICALCSSVNAIAAEKVWHDNWTEQQNIAHEIADLARSLGLPEDDPIIKRAQELWWADYEKMPGKQPVEVVPEPEPEPEMRYLGEYYITGYDICYECCGKIDGITASGAYATVGRTIAASREFPFGTKLYIDGIGVRVVEDRGGAIGGGRIDVLCNNHSECYAITGYYDVYIIE